MSELARQFGTSIRPPQQAIEALSAQGYLEEPPADRHLGMGFEALWKQRGGRVSRFGCHHERSPRAREIIAEITGLPAKT